MLASGNTSPCHHSLLLFAKTDESQHAGIVQKLSDQALTLNGKVTVTDVNGNVVQRASVSGSGSSVNQANCHNLDPLIKDAQRRAYDHIGEDIVDKVFNSNALKK